MQTVSAGGFHVDYVDTGSGPAVVLVHSSASGHRQWRRLVDELKHRYRVLAVNLFGYGSTSAWPAGRTQTLADQAELVAAVAARAGGPVILVGHSLGGAVSMEAALHLRGQVRAVVAFEPILFSLLKLNGRLHAFAEIHDLATRYCRLAAAGQWDDAGQVFVDYWSGAGAWSAMSDERKSGLRIMLPNVVHEWDAVIEPCRPLAAWGEIPAPVALLRSADTRQPTHGVADLLAGAHPHWRLHELPAGGHMAPLTRADLVNPVIVDLLADAVR